MKFRGYTQEIQRMRLDPHARPNHLYLDRPSGRAFLFFTTGPHYYRRALRRFPRR